MKKLCCINVLQSNKLLNLNIISKNTFFPFKSTSLLYTQSKIILKIVIESFPFCQKIITLFYSCFGTFFVKEKRAVYPLSVPSLRHVETPSKIVHRPVTIHAVYKNLIVLEII